MRSITEPSAQKCSFANRTSSVLDWILRHSVLTVRASGFGYSHQLFRLLLSWKELRLTPQ